MPSPALIWWQTDARQTLDKMAAAHAAVGGRGPGRRYATDQVNNAYVMLLSAQFQKYCRELHLLVTRRIGDEVPAPIRSMVVVRFTDGRKLDSGNPNPGNIGSDFNRFGFFFWDEVIQANPRNAILRQQLEQLNLWRNAIGHHDFSRPECAGRTSVRLSEVTRWRSACNRLAREFDAIMRRELVRLTRVKPW